MKVTLPKIKFSQHAIKRARQRGLVTYLDKKRFWFDAVHIDGTHAELDGCRYSFTRKKDGTIKITTLW